MAGLHDQRAPFGLRGDRHDLPTQLGQPILGEGIELDAIAAVVIGGTAMSGGQGGLSGTVIGTFIIIIFGTGSTYWRLGLLAEGGDRHRHPGRRTGGSVPPPHLGAGCQADDQDRRRVRRAEREGCDEPKTPDGHGGGRAGGPHRRRSPDGRLLDGRIELVCGAFSSDPEKSRERAPSSFSPADRVTASYEEMLAGRKGARPAGSIDFVSIVTPNHLHFPVAEAALETGFTSSATSP